MDLSNDIKSLFKEYKVEPNIVDNPNNFVFAYFMGFENFTAKISLVVDKKTDENGLRLFSFHVFLYELKETDATLIRAINKFNEESLFFKALVSDSILSCIHFGEASDAGLLTILANRIDDICGNDYDAINDLINSISPSIVSKAI